MLKLTTDNTKHCAASLRQQSYLFSEIWRYIDFQNGGRPLSWNCFTTIRDHPRRLCCWPQLPFKFHVNLMHRFEDIAIWICHIIWLEMPIQAPKTGFLGDFGRKCDHSSSRPPKGTSLRKSASFKLSTVKIRWGAWPVGELTESVTDTQTHTPSHTDTHTPHDDIGRAYASHRAAKIEFDHNNLVRFQWSLSREAE